MISSNIDTKIISTNNHEYNHRWYNNNFQQIFMIPSNIDTKIISTNNHEYK